MSKELLLQLVNATSESEVTKIIKNNPILKDPANWTPYGPSNNIGTFTGQAPEAVPCLVEKITNSTDALLIKKCKEYGDDPKGNDSPKTMEEALKKYFDLDQETYTNLSSADRRELATNIQVIAEGSRNKPNIVICDTGEGQSPQDFPNTFVSIGRDYKTSIFFVQGKYNMGGTAALPFCGEERYQLILSKRKITSSDRRSPFGFTLVRRNRAEKESARFSRYEYCITPDKKIFEFESEQLDLGLYNKKSFDGGTYLKLYEYDLRDPSNILLGLWRDLNRYMYKSALPILLYEKRDFAGHSNTKIMHGNRMRAFIDSRDSVEKIISGEIESDKVRYPFEGFVFKQDVQAVEFIKDMAVIFTVNGQVHHKLDNRFITQRAKKAYLKGSLLLNIDCTNIPRVLHEDMFRSDRSSVRDIEKYRNLENSIARELKDNDMLKQIDDERQKEKIYQNPKDEAFLKNIMSKLLRDDREIEKLLGLETGILGSTLKKIDKHIKHKGKNFQGKRFPSYFRFKHLKQGKVKMLPQNGECIIDIETDVENEYLIRPHEPGDLTIRVRTPHVRGGEGPITPKHPDEELLNVTQVGPSDGNVRLRIGPKKEVPIGESVFIDITMSSPCGDHLLTAEIKIDNPRKPSEKKQFPTKQEHSLPRLIEVYKTIERQSSTKSESNRTWDKMSPCWNENDICDIQESSKEGSCIDAVYINMDALELHKYIQSKKITGKNIERVMRTYKTVIYLLGLVIYHGLLQRIRIEENHGGNKYSSERVHYDPSDMVRFIMKNIARILLHITTNESLLKELDLLDD